MNFLNTQEQIKIRKEEKLKKDIPRIDYKKEAEK